MSFGEFVNFIATLNIPRSYTILSECTGFATQCTNIMIVNNIFDRFISLQDLHEDNLNKMQGFMSRRPFRVVILTGGVACALLILVQNFQVKKVK